MTTSTHHQDADTRSGTAWFSERASGRFRDWLERSANTAVLGPVFAYAQAHASQLVNFVLIGAVLAAFNLSILYCLRTWLHLPDPIAVTAMYILGALVHFPSHRWITYRAQDQPVGPQGLRYVIMLLWNFVIMQTLVGLASRLSISPYIAVMASTGFTMISNFLIMTHVVFARKRRE